MIIFSDCFLPFCVLSLLFYLSKFFKDKSLDPFSPLKNVYDGKEKNKKIPTVIKNKATVKGWLENLEISTGVFIQKDSQLLMCESNYLTIFRLCAKVAFLKNHTS